MRDMGVGSHSHLIRKDASLPIEAETHDTLVHEFHP